MWVLPDEDANRLIAEREAKAKRHAPTTPTTFEALLERCELYLAESGGDWMDEVRAGFSQSVKNARRSVGSSYPS